MVRLPTRHRPSLGRRNFLRGALAAGALSSIGIRSAAGLPSGRRGPRYVVVINQQGGTDGILTTDARTSREVQAGIDIPYTPAEIVEAGAHRFGPHMAAFAPYAKELTILHGVAVNTASHETGLDQLVRMKTNVVERMPSFTELIGRARDGQPFGAVALHADWRFYSPGTFGSTMAAKRPNRARSPSDSFSALDALSPEELRLLALSTEHELHRAELAGLPAATLDSMRSVVALVKRYPSLSKLGPPLPKENDDEYQLRRIAWLLQNDLTRGVFAMGLYTWDSHQENMAMQRYGSVPHFGAVANFFHVLKTTRNEHGLLADNTLVVLASEIGRFPYLNHRMGKDHFPEISMVFWGAGIQTGARIGQTGTRMEALPMSLKTGRADDHGDKLVLDDVGTTLLRLCGITPEQFGYHGRTIECLLG